MNKLKIIFKKESIYVQLFIYVEMFLLLWCNEGRHKRREILQTKYQLTSIIVKLHSIFTLFIYKCFCVVARR